MANYSINADLPGVKKVFASESATVVGSSTIIPVLVFPMDPDYMQETIDGYIPCNTNTDTSLIKITHSAALAANELAGHYAAVRDLSDGMTVRLILANTAATANAESTITVDRPYGSAPTDGCTVQIRLWEDWRIPKLFSSLQSFAERYVSKSGGNYVWTNSEAAYYTISEFLNNGGTLFYACPVPSSSVAATLTGTLSELPASTVFTAKMLQLSPQPEIICCAKQPKMEASLSVDNWAAIDLAFNTYISSRATSSTADDELREMVYISDTPTSNVATATTYRTTTLNSSAERMGLYHGQYLVSSLTRGLTQAVAVSPAVCGTINRVSTGAPESFGHAFEGANYTQVSAIGLVDQDITPANRLTLMSNGINPLISKPGRGFWIESQYTQAKSASDVGADPVEHLGVVIGRAKLWNAIQPILASVVSEPNTSVTRAGVLSRLDSLLSTYRNQGIIAGYSVADVTAAVDVTSGIARFESKIIFNREIDFVELKLTATLGV